MIDPPDHVHRALKSGGEASDIETVRAKPLITAAQLAALVAAVGATAFTSTASHWERPDLFLLLLALAVLSEAFPIETRRVRISGSFNALILIMAFCGPAPAVVAALATVVADYARSRSNAFRLVTNLSAYAVFPLIGAMIFEFADQRIGPDESVVMAAVVVAVFMAGNLLNFLLVVGPVAWIEGGPGLGERLRSVYLPVFPVEIAAGLLTATVAFGYLQIGIAAVALAGIVGFVYVYLLRVNLRATERGEQLEQRTQELASLQVGLVTTVLKTLAMRDHMTARHSAAVARYSLAVARALGLSERDQEMIHTAGLFHDVGKFIFPDSILLADRRLSDEDFVIVKKHPEQGAELVRRIQGYEDVADIIIAHHERIDGRGYPYGVRGDDIPLGSRIIAVADTYDVMTARDSYRTPVARAEAIAELRRVSGAQLDAHVVEIFIDLVSNGLVEFRHGDDADFEAELNFETRVREYAAPRVAA